MFSRLRPHMGAPSAIVAAPPDTRGLDLLHWRATRAFEAGALAEARQLWERAWRDAQRLLDPADERRFSIHRMLARVHDRLGNYDQAEALQQTLIEAYHQVHGPAHRDAFLAQDDLAVIYFHAERYDDARDLRTALLASMETSLGPADSATLHVMSNLEGNLLRMGEAEAALALTRERVKRLRSLHPAESEPVLWADNALAYTLSACARHDEAIALIHEVYERVVAQYGETAKLTLAFADSVADLLQTRGTSTDLEAAAQIQSHVLAYADACYSPLDSIYQGFVFTQATILAQQSLATHRPAIEALRERLLQQLTEAGAEQALLARMLRRFAGILGDPVAPIPSLPEAPVSLDLSGGPSPHAPSYPYLSFASFVDFLRSIRVAADGSTEEAAVQVALEALLEGGVHPPALAQQYRFALASLGLMTSALWPSRPLMTLLESLSDSASPSAFAAAFRPVVLAAYAPLLLDYETGAFFYATNEGIDQALQDFQVTNSAETARKMRTFFIRACQAAGLALPEKVSIRKSAGPRRVASPPPVVRTRPLAKPATIASESAESGAGLLAGAPKALQFVPLLATFDLPGLVALPAGAAVRVSVASDNSVIEIRRTSEGLEFLIP